MSCIVWHDPHLPGFHPIKQKYDNIQYNLKLLHLIMYMHNQQNHDSDSLV